MHQVHLQQAGRCKGQTLIPEVGLQMHQHVRSRTKKQERPKRVTIKFSQKRNGTQLVIALMAC
jgi:hypothetical protein